MKHLRPLAVLAAAILSVVPTAAQSTCGSGSTLTHYSGGNGNYAVMFDITPTVDMTIECIDVNMWATGAVVDATFDFTVGSCVGVETNPAAWSQFGSVTGVLGNTPGLPTNLDISGNGQVFLAGQTYGIYIQSPGNILAYTNGGPTPYSGDHCDLMTYYGSTLNWGGVNLNREFNGELHTEPVQSGPSLALGGSCPGVQTADASGMTVGGAVAFYYAVAAGNTVLPGGACAGLALPVSAPQQLGGFVIADGAGNASLPGASQPNHCGLVILGAVDVASCTGTNTVTL